MRKYILLYIDNSATNKISKSFPTVVYIVIENGGNNDDIHRNLKYYIPSVKSSLKNTEI